MYAMGDAACAACTAAVGKNWGRVEPGRASKHEAATRRPPAQNLRDVRYATDVAVSYRRLFDGGSLLCEVADGQHLYRMPRPYRECCDTNAGMDLA